MMAVWPVKENRRRTFCRNARSSLSENLERAKGIEPSYAAWEAAVLPLNYARERRQPTNFRRTVQIFVCHNHGAPSYNSSRVRGLTSPIQYQKGFRM